MSNSSNRSKSLAGKTALVTGGSRGIGAAIARHLAAAGADVAISYAASSDKADAVVRELEALGVRAAAFKADQADARQVARRSGMSLPGSAGSTSWSTMPASPRWARPAIPRPTMAHSTVSWQ